MKLTEKSLIDHNLSENNVCCPLSREQIRQILKNQEIVEKIEKLVKDNDGTFKFTEEGADVLRCWVKLTRLLATKEKK